MPVRFVYVVQLTEPVSNASNGRHLSRSTNNVPPEMCLKRQISRIVEPSLESFVDKRSQAESSLTRLSIAAEDTSRLQNSVRACEGTVNFGLVRGVTAPRTLVWVLVKANENVGRVGDNGVGR